MFFIVIWSDGRMQGVTATTEREALDILTAKRCREEGRRFKSYAVSIRARRSNARPLPERAYRKGAPISFT